MKFRVGSLVVVGAVLLFVGCKVRTQSQLYAGEDATSKYTVENAHTFDPYTEFPIPNTIRGPESFQKYGHSC